MTTTNRRQYRVTTKHPKGWQDGTHLFTCSRDGDRGWYAKASSFGCSRTYRSELDAVYAMCADHACRVTKVEAVDDVQQ